MNHEAILALIGKLYDQLNESEANVAKLATMVKEQQERISSLESGAKADD